MNKKAQMDLLVLWLYRIFLITVIGFFVVVIVGRLYGTYDIRPAEASVITERISDCLRKNPGSESAFLSKCAGIPEKEVYVNISIYNATSFVRSVIIGNEAYDTYCQAIENGNKMTFPPSCMRSIQYIDSNKIAKLLVAVRKIEKNV